MVSAMAVTVASSKVPSAKGLPVLGVLPYLPRDPFGFCMKAAADGEGLVRLDVGPVKAYVVSHPDYVRHILVSNSQNYIKGKIMDGIRFALGNGLFTSDGDFWRRQRRLMQPAFHAKRIEWMFGIIDEVISTGMRGWTPTIDSGDPVDILVESTQLNIKIVLRSLFGATADDEQTERLLVLTNQVFRGMTERVWTFFLPRWIPTPGASGYRRAVAALDAEIYSIIAARRASSVEHGDLLDLLLSVEDEDTGERMSDQQLRDEIFTIFIAGYESTSSGITWACHLLSRHPEIFARLQEEVDGVDREPDFRVLGELPYLKMVVNETFRLYPAFPMYFRSSVESDQVGPYSLPGGAQIIVSPYATHHDPRYWDDPEVFDPERFSAERFDARARNAYYPFGRGQRMCIGEPMSMAIVQLFLLRFARDFAISEVPDTEIRPHYAMTYQPKDGLPLRLTSRAL